MTVRSQWVVFWAGYMYVSVKKQYPEMSYNNVKTYKFFCLFGLWPNAFFVKVVLWKDSKSYLYWFMNVFVTDSWHQTWCLPLLWHLMGSFPLLCGHWVWVACLAWHLFPSTAEIWHFFLFFFPVSWLVIVTLPLTPAILNVFIIDPLVFMTQS